MPQKISSFVGRQISLHSLRYLDSCYGFDVDDIKGEKCHPCGRCRSPRPSTVRALSYWVITASDENIHINWDDVPLGEGGGARTE
jgi:hypothetical protein